MGIVHIVHVSIIVIVQSDIVIPWWIECNEHSTVVCARERQRKYLFLHDICFIVSQFIPHTAVVIYGHNILQFNRVSVENIVLNGIPYHTKGCINTVLHWMNALSGFESALAL